VTALDFADRSSSAFSPRLSVLYRATKNLSIAGTYSEGFRRPTLNELYRNFRVGDIRDNYADIRKIGSVLGFEPRVSFEQGVARFVEWVGSQQVPADNFEASIAEMKQKGLYK
jgi:dTDP-L-rhamnose 4-epimerase